MTPSQLSPLPLDNAWPEIWDALNSHRNLVLVAEPGAGKTTRFPPRLIQSGLISSSQKVFVLEPRRLATRAAAHRIAEEQNWRVGTEVGYQVRFENRTSSQTRLHVLTEGLLTRKLQTDPELSDVGAVILDEFHERSHHTDLAISLLFELQELSRPDLRLIVMSATMDAERVASFLGDCPIVKVPGRTHPVRIQNSKLPLRLETGPAFLDLVAQNTLQAMRGEKECLGDILVFLPGTREIRGVRERLEPSARALGFECFELHGSLPLEEQDRAIRKLQGRGKVILSTNIAETSLTVDGVGTVIDSGLARVVRMDALGFDRLQLSRISLASATQRAGRAGRQGPGLCYRLWSSMDEASLPPFERPEILRTDISEALLILSSQDITDPENFTWFEKPPQEAIRTGLRLLSDLRFIDSENRLTPEGRVALKLPLSARLARLMLDAIAIDHIELGAELCALLSEKDILLQSRSLRDRAQIESDLLVRWHLLHEDLPGTDVDRTAVRNVKRVASSLMEIGKGIRGFTRKYDASWTLSKSIDEIAMRLLLVAFPDRLCRRRRPKETAALMVGGRGALLSPHSVVETAEFFLALDSSEAASASPALRSDPLITVASRIERSWLEFHFSQSLEANSSQRSFGRVSRIVFDEVSQSVQKQILTMFADLPLEEPQVSRPTGDEVGTLLLQACKQKWISHFENHDELKPFFARLRFLEREGVPLDWETTRNGFLEEVCFGETRLMEVLAKPLAQAFSRHLSSETARQLDEWAPDFIVVPSGSRIRLHYPEDRPPFLEVRIQEVFGLRSSPRLAHGRVPIALHLLGPNFRPVQVTSDLESFWKNGYTEIRKELRARYPKHSWPEDPLNATPEAKGRRRP